MQENKKHSMDLPPLIAILRGIKPLDILSAIDILVEAGFKAIEVPLNSPNPFQSISMAVKHAPADVLIGAGTVLTAAQVHDLHNAGGMLMIAPNVNQEPIMAALNHGMMVIPGIFTATEALLACSYKVHAIKVFPAHCLGASGIASMRAVLPKDMPIIAVGGVSESDFAHYSAHGIKHFGLGSSLYKPNMSMQTLKENAEKAMKAIKGITA